MKFSLSDSKKSVNFIFLRHGFACHNAATLLRKSGIEISRQTDPELTDIGVDATIHNGCIISNTLRREGIDKIHLVGSSGLIRSMETAHYITSKWKSPPQKIYVFPYLRELDESTLSYKTAEQNRIAQAYRTNYLKPKYSANSRQTIDSIPSYAMKSIPEQKAYLQTTEFGDKIDFKYVQTGLRGEPGDIYSFIDWVHRNSIQRLAKQGKDSINILVITHAGVLVDFFLTEKKREHDFPNNSGFIVKTTFTNRGFQLGNITPLDVPTEFYTRYKDTNTMDYYCPSRRCDFCTNAKISGPQKRISPQLAPDDKKSCGEYNA